MRYSLCADIMFVGVGEHGPVWPDTDGILAAIDLAAKNGLNGIEAKPPCSLIAKNRKKVSDRGHGFYEEK